MAHDTPPASPRLPEVPADRRFDQEETARILRRATELRPVLPATLSGAADGVTLAQLVAAAEEAGINPEAVRRAASELTVPEALRVSPWYGAATRIVEERVIGRAMAVEEFDAFTDDVRRLYGMMGVVSTTPRGLTWASLLPGTAAPAGRRLSVSLAVRGSTTVLRVEEDLTPDVAGYFGAATGFGAIGMIAAVGVLGSFGSVLAFGAPIVPVSLLAGARALFRRTAERRRAEASAIATQLATRCERSLL